MSDYLPKATMWVPLFDRGEWPSGDGALVHGAPPEEGELLGYAKREVEPGEQLWINGSKPLADALSQVEGCWRWANR